MRRRAAHIATLSRSAQRLPRSFFARPTVDVARDLVGCRLLVDAGLPSTVLAVIVECEAYLGLDDPASHAFRGPTPRAGIMFGAPGHLYVYLSRGIHHCANVVTEPDGTAGAVLLRAAAVVHGQEVARRRRGLAVADDALLRGPGNLTCGLAFTLRDNGADLCDGHGRISILAGVEDVPPEVMTAPRVGINVAVERPLRFVWRAHAAVSAPRPWSTRKGPD
jgi:DNA-3-methyladenine glycosylase